MYGTHGLAQAQNKTPQQHLAQVYSMFFGDLRRHIHAPGSLATPPAAGHAPWSLSPGLWSRPRSLVIPPVAGRAPRSLVTPPGRWSRPWSPVTPPVAGHAPRRWSRPPEGQDITDHPTTPPPKNSLHPTRCVELAASNSLCCVSVPGLAECAKRLNKKASA